MNLYRTIQDSQVNTLTQNDEKNVEKKHSVRVSYFWKVSSQQWNRS